ncbi:conserved hypothetical protein [Halomonas sp. 59]|uniref:hypothetical protein n=2 Tax=Halomonadaceae TaxID=28256 RepID=UPI0012F2B322|nr:MULTISPECIES: hypothetical protein [Halomonas]CAD5264521.1 conserved hypothetical protein [Halomonas sp. 156]CAD5265690.1 conserved hypothetical protein [Halomonas sp. I3]CAD5284120.1 conserved hypothetical protein [Halomonas sp. 113]CAD5285583.1 conserved hypothetical protein [Halomonas sp. 59]VXB27205.1 conserved hypothetical protein [Halomonas titanicae]
MNQPATTTQQTDRNSNEGLSMETAKSEVQAPVPAKGGKAPGRSLTYFDAPYIASCISEEDLRENVENGLKRYLTRRRKLTEVCNELDRLKKTLSALEQEGEEADGEWKQSFLKGFGKQTKSMRDKVKQKTQAKLEAEQIKEMIELLEPQAQWIKMYTYLARNALVDNKSRLIDLVTHNRLIEAVDELSRNTECMAKLGEVVKYLFERIETDTCNDHAYMATLGIDAWKQKGAAYKAVMNYEDTAQLNREVSRRQMSALGDLFLSRIPVDHKRIKLPGTEIPERLPFEDYKDGGYYSPIRFPRELKELEEKMGFVPSLDELDNDDTAA